MTRLWRWLCYQCLGYVRIEMAHCPRCAGGPPVPFCEDCILLGNACPTHGDPTRPEPRGVLS